MSYFKKVSRIGVADSDLSISKRIEAIKNHHWNRHYPVFAYCGFPAEKESDKSWSFEFRSDKIPLDIPCTFKGIFKEMYEDGMTYGVFLEMHKNVLRREIRTMFMGFGVKTIPTQSYKIKMEDSFPFICMPDYIGQNISVIGKVSGTFLLVPKGYYSVFIGNGHSVINEASRLAGGRLTIKEI